MVRGLGMDAGAIFGQLPGQSLLHSLDAEELKEVLTLAREHKAEKGKVLLGQGDEANFLLILVEGSARITVYSANGREIVLGYSAVGSVLGEIALLDGGTRTASVIAMEPVKYLTLGRGAFEQVVMRNPRVALRMMREMASRLRLANQTIETDRAYAAASRLARFLLRLVKPDDRNPRITLSQTELSMFAGISRENINRQLGLWAQAGIVAMEQGQIRILELEPLEDIADAME